MIPFSSGVLIGLALILVGIVFYFFGQNRRTAALFIVIGGIIAFLTLAGIAAVGLFMN